MAQGMLSHDEQKNHAKYHIIPRFFPEFFLDIILSNIQTSLYCRPTALD